MNGRSRGDSAAGYSAVRERAGVVERTDRTLLRLYGRDPQRILQGIITNDVNLATDTRAVYAALLTPKGRMLADLRVLRDGAEFLLELPTIAAPAVLEYLRRTVPPLFARYQELGDTRQVIGVHGPAARAALEGVVDGALPDAAEDALTRVRFQDEDCIVRGTRYTGTDGYDVVCSRAAGEALRARLVAAGVEEVGEAVLDVLRIEAAVPAWGAELSENTIPLEAGLERAISTSKGCYTGQEVIIRILHRGHVNWHLRRVLLGDSPSPGRDTPLHAPESGRSVGRITSAAWSPRFGQAIALAYVRREIEPPAVLRLGGPEGAEVRIESTKATS